MTREELNNDKQKEIIKEENWKKRKKVVLTILKFIVLIIILFTSFYLYVTKISTSSILVKEERLISSKIPNSFNGATIIQFSDIHYGRNIQKKQLEKIVGLINEREPDIVLFTGDLIAKEYEINNQEQEQIIEILSKIKANIGKYAIAGDEDKKYFSTIMNQSQFIILNNQYELLYNNSNDAIVLAGFSENEFTIEEEVQKQNLYSIAIYHQPDITDSILEKNHFDLLLSGHSHNGNIQIPFIGPIFTVEGAKKYNKEHYTIGDSELYISSGLGTNEEGIRLFCRPSINFYRISNS